MSSCVHSIFSIITTTTTWLLTHLHPLDISLSVLALFLLLSLRQRLTSHPAAPMSWPILGLLPHLLLHHAHLHTWNTRVLSRCPNATYPISGLTRNFRGIVTADPIKVEYMLCTHFLNFPKGKFYRDRFQELLGSGIFNADGDAWRVQRRIAAAEMHTARFRTFSLETMRRLVHQKLLKLVAHAAAGNDDEGDQAVDLQEWLLRFTFDNVCVVALGVDPGCLDGEILPFARAFEVATECSLLRFLVPPVVWKGMRAVNVGTERKLKDAVKVVHEFAENVVKNRKADILSSSSSSSNVVNGDDAAGGGRNDLLSRLMIMRVQDYDKGVVDEEYSRNKEMNSVRFSDEFLRDFCISFILAGRDTSSVALAWFFWLVHENPRVEEKILQEIKEIFSLRKRRSGSSTIDATTDQIEKVVEEEEEKEEPLELDDVVFDADELDSMVYLEAVLTEAMRLYPPVPIDFKEVDEDDTYPDGTPVKKGDKVFYHTFAMGRLPSLWGHDAEDFTPERWLKNSNDGGGGGGVQQVAAVSPFKYAVFNAGPRLCVGKRFAYVQMKMVAASVLVRFKVKVVEGQVITPKITTTLYMKNGLKVTFHPR